MMGLQKEMGKGFNLQTPQAKRVYTILDFVWIYVWIYVH